MNIYKLKTRAILILIAFFTSLTISEEIADDESGSFTLKVLPTPGGACSNYLDKKGWQEGFQILGSGAETFFAMGESSVKAPKGSNASENMAYIDSIQTAYAVAALSAKRKLAEAWSLKIKSDIKNSMIERVKSGTPPKFLLEEREAEQKDKLINNTNSDELSMFEKTKLLINQKLDSMLSDETKQKLEDDNLAEAEAAKILEEEINKITDQSSFSQTIESAAQAEIKGMKTVYTNKSKTGVCVVAGYSEKTSKQADALATGNLSIMTGLKPSKPFSRRIPNHKSQEGLMELLGMFGAHIARNEKGEMGIISYAQAGSQRSDSTSLGFAFNVATAKARAQIAQLSNENIAVQNKLQQIEVATGFANSDLKEYYSERNSEDRMNASSRLTVSGVSEWGRWTVENPDTKSPMVGVILTWTPSGADFANRSRDASKERGSNSGSSKSTWSEESGYTSGGSSGDDEEDF